MKLQSVKSHVCAISACTILLFSCRKEAANESAQTLATPESSSATLHAPLDPKVKMYAAKLRKRNAAIVKTDPYYSNLFNKPQNAVAPSPCNTTALDAVVEGYFNQFEFWDFILFPDYVAINQLSSIIDQSKQYFGRNGQYTHLVTKQQRRLESFWALPNKIRINGQHSETLGNREKIADAFMIYGNATRDDAYYIADQIISMNEESKVFPESPLLSFDGFATTTNLIVIGDGLIEALTATGVVDEIVVAGLVSHEWGHQVQFANLKKWYGLSADNLILTPALTRQLEMEADFFSAYFLTHKRGGAYNWKRVAEFNELFFNIGDCAFESSGHHGTPRQRLNAAKLGYSIASNTKPMGHILKPEELHALFIRNFQSLL